MSDAISTEIKARCDCCEEMKKVRMYVLQDGNTAWVCKKCRGKK